MRGTKSREMLRFLLIFVGLVTTILANNPQQIDTSSKILEELTKNANETSEKLNRLTKLVYDQEKTLKSFDQKLNDLAKQTNKQFEDVNSFVRCAPDSLLTALPNGKKYLFSHSSSVEWKEANETCTKQGLLLATIKDEDDASVIASVGRRISPHRGWWVSAKNSGGEKKDFRWRDGSKLELDSPLWARDVDKADDCVRIHNKLDSLPCDSHWYFICELPTECY
ncbi:C-type lectin domain family 1 member B-like isoform X2 [Neocloeon triangulifer]|uniref:C-type lectin domain family 1 member B-like isoform X2 n=1 Tax=Neocloeon triangulifer TaxID=2078957 RepID=UPI00286ECF82|nr:C-type lectin domain family 1 member B-like isoform X2 [Neocloeon triangulifer]